MTSENHGIARTAAEAVARGYAKSTRTPPAEAKGSGWIHIAHLGATEGDICYIGPCNEGSTTRPVCYFDDQGSCTNCYDEEDHACGG